MLKTEQERLDEQLHSLEVLYLADVINPQEYDRIKARIQRSSSENGRAFESIRRSGVCG